MNTLEMTGRFKSLKKEIEDVKENKIEMKNRMTKVSLNSLNGQIAGWRWQRE